MDAQATEGLLRFFRSIHDPRAANAWHRLDDILAISILAVLCGAEGWAAVEAWAGGNRDWLETFLELPHGIPTHDTFDRVFAMLDPLAFEQCFQKWTAALVQNAGEPADVVREGQESLGRGHPRQIPGDASRPFRGD